MRLEVDAAVVGHLVQRLHLVFLRKALPVLAFDCVDQELASKLSIGQFMLRSPQHLQVGLFVAREAVPLSRHSTAVLVAPDLNQNVLEVIAQLEVSTVGRNLCTDELILREGHSQFQELASNLLLQLRV